MQLNDDLITHLKLKYSEDPDSKFHVLLYMYKARPDLLQLAIDTFNPVDANDTENWWYVINSAQSFWFMISQVKENEIEAKFPESLTRMKALINEKK